MNHHQTILSYNYSKIIIDNYKLLINAMAYDAESRERASSYLILCKKYNFCFIDETNLLSRDKRATSTMTIVTHSMDVADQKIPKHLDSGSSTRKQKRSVIDGKESIDSIAGPYPPSVIKSRVLNAPRSSSGRIINNRADDGASFSGETNKSYHRFSGFFKGNEHTNQTVVAAQKIVGKVFDLKKVENNDNKHKNKFIVLEEDKNIKNSLWSESKKENLRYDDDDDTSGIGEQAVRKESETRRSRYVGPSVAATVTTTPYTLKINERGEEENFRKTKEQVRKENRFAHFFTQAINGHGGLEEAKSSKRNPSSSEKVGLTKKVGESKRSEKFTKDITGGIAFSYDLPTLSSQEGYSLQFSIKPHENIAQKQQQLEVRRSKRSQSEGMTPSDVNSSLNKNYNRNLMHRSRHQYGSSFKTDYFSSYDPVVSNYPSTPMLRHTTWPNFGGVGRSNKDNETSRTEKRMTTSAFSSSAEESFNFIRNNYNNRYATRKYSAGRKTSNSDDYNQVMTEPTFPLESTPLLGNDASHQVTTLATETTFTRRLSSEAEHSSSSVLVPNLVDDYVNDNDDLVILASSRKSRKRRYGGLQETSDSTTKTYSKYNGYSNGYRETHNHENDLDNNSEGNLMSDKFPKDPNFREDGGVYESASFPPNFETASSYNGEYVGGGGLGTRQKPGAGYDPVAERHVDEPTRSPFSSVNSIKDDGSERSADNPFNKVITERGDNDRHVGSGRFGATPENDAGMCRDGPHYVVYAWVLCMVSLAAFLKLYFMVKITVIVVLFVTYSVLILWPFNGYFTKHSDAGEINTYEIIQINYHITC